MLILRKHYYEQKEFSDIKNFEGDSTSGMMFLMKIILMNDLDNGKHIEHWIESAGTCIFDCTNNIKLNGFIKNYAVPFLGFSFQSERKRYLNNLFKELNSNSPYSYVKDIIENVQYQSKGGELKYLSKLRDLKEDEIDCIIDKFRYIAMCLSDQINEETVEWWEINSNTDRINFLFLDTSINDIISLQRKLLSIMKKIEPYIETVNFTTKFR